MAKPKTKVRYVKFSPEEMACDPSPEETKDWTFVGRGQNALFAKPSDGRMAKLDPDVAKFFSDDKTVNEALRRAMGLMKMKAASRNRKSA